MKFRAPLLICLFLIFTSAVYAQSVCPPDILLSFARSGSTCFDLDPNQSCIGNGVVESQLFPLNNLPDLAKPGDRINAAAIQSLHTQPIEKGISAAIIFTQANLTDAQERGAALFLFGDTTVENRVQPLLELTTFAKGTVNIRRTPDEKGDIITKMAVNQAVIANGRTQAGDWLRVHVPNSNDLGWVGADVVNPEGNILSLAVVDVDTPVFKPFQVFNVTSTTETTFCGGALPSGLLLQTPNLTTVQLGINGIDMQLNGTFFLQTSDILTVNVLAGEGIFTVGGVSQFIPAGTRTQIETVPGEPEGYDNAAFQALPINNLPNQMQIAVALTSDQIAQKIAEHLASLAEAAAEPIAVGEDTTCHRLTKHDTTLWGGPGLFYEAVNEIDAGRALDPILQTTDTDGHVWWQLRNSNWVQASQVEQTGECRDIPVTAVVAPPNSNHLSLETCETTNGPLRADQYVTIEFIPPPWDNFGEARDAVSIDPGRITIDSETYGAYASQPIRIGPESDRYLRRFYIVWEAEPGTYRIVGDRLHYTPICTVTVPVG